MNASWPADKVERWPVAKLVPNARNTRTHSDEHVTQLAASIEEWGWTIPVLVERGGRHYRRARPGARGASARYRRRARHGRGRVGRRQEAGFHGFGKQTFAGT